MKRGEECGGMFERLYEEVVWETQGKERVERIAVMIRSELSHSQAYLEVWE